MVEPLWMWGIFFVFVTALLVLDLGVFHKKDKEIGIRESLLTSAFYISMGLLFGGWVWLTLGVSAASLYLTGFLVEKSLSLDNIFIISLIFSYFAIPKKLQHNVLFWGVLGVVILRGIMIGLGATIVAQFHWVLYIFAGFLVFTGFKMLFMADHGAEDIGDNPVLKFFRRHLRVTPDFEGRKFFVRKPENLKGRLVWYATPLLLALIVIECVDLVFALDSIPAILSITTDPYIVYTSNIFAILGLRALYFALSVIIARFKYLKYALALVLIFIGGKVFAGGFLGLEATPWLSLLVTVGLLAGGILFSLYKTSQIDTKNP